MTASYLLASLVRNHLEVVVDPFLVGQVEVVGPFLEGEVDPFLVGEVVPFLEEEVEEGHLQGEEVVEGCPFQEEVAVVEARLPSLGGGEYLRVEVVEVEYHQVVEGCHQEVEEEGEV